MLQKKENPFWNITFNLILPVLILNKAHDLFPEFHSIYILLIALSLPLIYGLKDYLKDKKINVISIIGLVGILLTGGLALFQTKGIVFAIKEAAIPLLIAFFTLGSIVYKKPLVVLFLKSSFFKSDLIFQRIKENQQEKNFSRLMNVTTFWLALSFVLSAILNFIIAERVFQQTDSQQVLNEQVARMTWLGYVVIALPLSVLSGFILWYLVKNLKRMTQLRFQDMVSQ